MYVEINNLFVIGFLLFINLDLVCISLGLAYSLTFIHSGERRVQNEIKVVQKEPPFGKIFQCLLDRFLGFSFFHFGRP